MTDVVIEVAPDVSSSNGSGDEQKCPDCDFARSGKWAKGQVGAHRFQAHGYRKAAGAKRVRAQKKPAVNKATSAKTAGTAPAPRPAARRPATKLLSPLWGVLGARVPGRAGGAMIWQAPFAGQALDNMLSGTIVDRLLLQKVMKQEGKVGDVTDLLVLPMAGYMVDSGAFGRLPAVWQQAIMGQATETIINSMETVLEADIKRKAKLARLDARAREAGMEGLEQTVTEIMGAIFGQPEPARAPAEPVEPLVPAG